MKLNADKTITRFNGLNNKADPMRGTDPGTKQAQTWEWLQEADDVNVTDSGGLARREGYQSFLAATSITGSYSTFDFTRAYIVDAGNLKRVYSDGTTSTLQTGLSGPCYWAEINNNVYLSCSTGGYRIEPADTVSRWSTPTPGQPTVYAVSGSLHAGTYQVVLTYTDSFGREGGACSAAVVVCPEDGGIAVTNIPQMDGYVAQLYVTDADGTVFYHVGSMGGNAAYTVSTPSQGREITTQFLDEPPSGQYLTFMGANLYVSEYVPEIDQTVIWFSQPMGYHLFNLNTDFFVVPGEVTQLFGSSSGMLIATQTRIFLYDNDKLTQEAEYGAVPGQHADIGEDKKVYFWSKRGLCRIAPFENMTEAAVSVAPGVYAGGGIINKGGYKKYVAVMQKGGSAFNSRS